MSDRVVHAVDNHTSRGPPASRAATATWLITSGVLIALALWLRIDSPRLAQDVLQHLTHRNIFVAGNLLAGAVYLASCLNLRRPMGKWLFAWMLLAGLICRLVMLGGTPVLSTDYYRFLWDGAVLAQGHNPWRYSPQAVFKHSNPGIDPALTAMARAHPRIMRGINHAGIATIYPPVSELAMALAAKIAPFSVTALKTVYLIFDVATAILIVVILRRLHRSASWLLIYWWNPVLINAFYNEAHMDVITLGFVTLFALLVVVDRPIPAAMALGLATGAKFWPIVLATVLLRPLLGRPKQLGIVLLVLATVSTVALAPMFLTGAPAFHSLISYGRYWHENDGVFRLISMFWHRVFPSSAYTVSALASRATIAVIYLAALTGLNRKAAVGMDAIRISLFSVMLIFLLSPTEFPWYYT
ncbi:MAG: glycosyltransferase 87 family protein, partial [Phycisphaerae bacterium]